MPTKLNAEIIHAAIEGFESQKRRIDSQIAELRGMLDGSSRPESATAPESSSRRRRRKMSREARARIAAAQRLRWANAKDEAGPAKTAATEAPKRKRRMSKEGRARIIAATKARWARVRGEKAAAARKKTARTTTTKKAAAKKSAPAAASPATA